MATPPLYQDRMGRMVTFASRIAADGYAGPPAMPDYAVRAVGIDEKTALLLERDGNLTAAGSGTAYMCSLPAASLAASTACR